MINKCVVQGLIDDLRCVLTEVHGKACPLPTDIIPEEFLYDDGIDDPEESSSDEGEANQICISGPTDPHANGTSILPDLEELLDLTEMASASNDFVDSAPVDMSGD
jgi:hypothetical protein